LEKILSFEELKEDYNSRNKGCGSWLGKVYVPGHIDHRVLPIIEKRNKVKKSIELNDGSIVYNVKYQTKKLKDPEFYKEYVEDKLIGLTCKNYNCKHCRETLKNNLHQQIQKEVLIHNLNNHNVITFPGLSERLKNNYIQSYKLVNTDWHKLVRLMNYHYDRLKKGKYWSFDNSMFYENKLPADPLMYICLPRAQANPKDDNPAGFCHLHNIMNWQLNVYWLEEIIKKNNYMLGFTYVTPNKDVADYLCKDFFNDNEWILPKNVKHCHSSMGINLNPKFVLDPAIKIFRKMKLSDIEIELRSNKTNYKIFGKEFTVKNPLILPFEEYVKQFYDLSNFNDYGSLKRYSNYNKKHNDFVFKRGK
jgi:hypothetical protein